MKKRITPIETPSNEPSPQLLADLNRIGELMRQVYFTPDQKKEMFDFFKQYVDQTFPYQTYTEGCNQCGLMNSLSTIYQRLCDWMVNEKNKWNLN